MAYSQLKVIYKHVYTHNSLLLSNTNFLEIRLPTVICQIFLKLFSILKIIILPASTKINNIHQNVL